MIHKFVAEVDAETLCPCRRAERSEVSRPPCGRSRQRISVSITRHPHRFHEWYTMTWLQQMTFNADGSAF
ncbi:hypothetical protein [Roseiflexus castenholzii]|uniref:hypothetical protein n=1 Tax=Roseiflexus castenholzii TaxID=120962 RepID=UPI0012ECFD59|nr:hypothetical protein [Roseiflexus castenholzii]